MKKNISPFTTRQYMTGSDYEIYHYFDTSLLNILPHAHDHYEFYYFLGGQVDYVIGNQVYSLLKGDFLLLPPGLLHYPNALKGDAAYERIVLWINLDFFEHLADIDSDLNYIWEAVRRKNSYHIRPTTSASQAVANQLFYALEETEHKGFSSQMYLFSILGVLFVQVNRILYSMEHFQRHTPVQDLYSNVLYYIHTHLTEELSLEILSCEFFVSKSYISKIFREHLDISVYQYILFLRLEGIKNAILSGVPISKASETFGFHDYPSFYRAFKKVYSVPPKYFKKQP